jgi:predicted RNase H-like HicB family nuclease
MPDRSGLRHNDCHRVAERAGRRQGRGVASRGLSPAPAAGCQCYTLGHSGAVTCADGRCENYGVPSGLERDETGGVVAYCPTLKGCVSQGETEEETLENIKDAIVTYLQSLEDLKKIRPMDLGRREHFRFRPMAFRGEPRHPDGPGAPGPPCTTLDWRRASSDQTRRFRRARPASAPPRETPC